MTHPSQDLWFMPEGSVPRPVGDATAVLTGQGNRPFVAPVANMGQPSSSPSVLGSTTALRRKRPRTATVTKPQASVVVPESDVLARQADLRALATAAQMSRTPPIVESAGAKPDSASRSNQSCIPPVSVGSHKPLTGLTGGNTSNKTAISADKTQAAASMSTLTSTLDNSSTSTRLLDASAAPISSAVASATSAVSSGYASRPELSADVHAAVPTPAASKKRGRSRRGPLWPRKAKKTTDDSDKNPSDAQTHTQHSQCLPNADESLGEGTAAMTTTSNSVAGPDLSVQRRSESAQIDLPGGRSGSTTTTVTEVVAERTVNDDEGDMSATQSHCATDTRESGAQIHDHASSADSSASAPLLTIGTATLISSLADQRGGSDSEGIPIAGLGPTITQDEVLNSPQDTPHSKTPSSNGSAPSVATRSRSIADSIATAKEHAVVDELPAHPVLVNLASISSHSSARSSVSRSGSVADRAEDEAGSEVNAKRRSSRRNRGVMRKPSPALRSRKSQANADNAEPADERPRSGENQGESTNADAEKTQADEPHATWLFSVLSWPKKGEQLTNTVLHNRQKRMDCFAADLDGIRKMTLRRRTEAEDDLRRALRESAFKNTEVKEHRLRLVALQREADELASSENRTRTKRAEDIEDEQRLEKQRWPSLQWEQDTATADLQRAEENWAREREKSNHWERLLGEVDSMCRVYSFADDPAVSDQPGSSSLAVVDGN
ncbi:hypothetical protein ANO11243_093080 [Dothideomycetidae sp. 11243]|nr:hypothetical protein ANO11243_093080 [fungal sp. No.11243]